MMPPQSRPTSVKNGRQEVIDDLSEIIDPLLGGVLENRHACFLAIIICTDTTKSAEWIIETYCLRRPLGVTFYWCIDIEVRSLERRRFEKAFISRKRARLVATPTEIVTAPYLYTIPFEAACWRMASKTF
jgi:hypothetical protein